MVAGAAAVMVAATICWLLLLLVIPCLVECTADGDALLRAIGKWSAQKPASWTGDDPCRQNWEGVICDAKLRVSHLDLSNKGLVGDVPSDMASLDALVSLNLGNAKDSFGMAVNQITGDLSALSGLTKLQILNVSANTKLSTFPLPVLQLTSLTNLRLDNSFLTGPFPSGLPKLSQLQYLYLGNNSMTGPLPSELGDMTSLLELSLWNNSFSSLIPAELGSLSNLRYLNLHSCNLFGGLPSEFQNLKSLQNLSLYENLLTGAIPDSWGNMQSLQELRLSSNYLTKHFPSWIDSLASLRRVDISYNLLYGPLPNITSTYLTSLSVSCNFFTGASLTSSRITVTDAQNCLDGHAQDDNRDICHSYYTCATFSKAVQYGQCPTCPVEQIQTDVRLCICSQESSNQDKDSGGQSKFHELAKIIGPIVGAILVLAFCLFGFFVFRKHRLFEHTLSEQKMFSEYGHKFHTKELQGEWEPPKEVQRFSLEELANATSGFASDHEIGVGGFGKVFYGVLANGKKVAIKVASASSMQGSTEFRNEVVLLSRLHHRNLVRLEGFCEDNELQILVYEYVPNGNLHMHLFQSTTEKSLDWLRRLDIAVGIAQGLDYLHSFADPPVIHRDVKPGNILLDYNLVAKVADFGISKTTVEYETHISTRPAGTAGYIDPQYFLRRQLTTASDVYGFGVVLLELITGQKAIDPFRLEDHNLVEWVKVKLKARGVEDILDPRMGDNVPLHVYGDVTRLAVECAAFNKNDRPTMKTVVTVLDACLRAVCPLPPRVIDDHEYQDRFRALQVLEDDEDKNGGEEKEVEMTDTRREKEVITFSSTLSASKSAFQGSTLLPR